VAAAVVGELARFLDVARERLLVVEPRWKPLTAARGILSLVQAVMTVVG